MTRSLALVLLAALAGCDDPEAPDGGLPPDAPAPPACTWTPPAEPEDIAEPEAYTPRWAFEPWISKDISDRDDSYAFVDGFIERDIPVGVLAAPPNAVVAKVRLCRADLPENAAPLGQKHRIVMTQAIRTIGTATCRGSQLA